MISKEKFIEIIEFIKKKNDQENAFCSTLEIMSPGCYVDAFIYSEYNDVIIDLLYSNLNLDPDDDILYYFMYDLDFGKKYTDGCFIDSNGENVDISTAEKLYNYIVGNNDSVEWDEVDESVEVLTAEQFDKLNEYKEENIENGNN